jgi:hypothetical protein
MDHTTSRTCDECLEPVYQKADFSLGACGKIARRTIVILYAIRRLN